MIPKTLTPGEVVFHHQMHRLYRIIRGRVAKEMSPLDPGFAEAVRQAFKEQVIVGSPERNGRHA